MMQYPITCLRYCLMTTATVSVDCIQCNDAEAGIENHLNRKIKMSEIQKLLNFTNSVFEIHVHIQPTHTQKKDYSMQTTYIQSGQVSKADKE